MSPAADAALPERELALGRSLESAYQDLRLALRNLLKNRAFSLVALSALAIGIGSNSAIFSLLNGVLLRPYPYAQPEQLVMILGTRPSSGVAQAPISYPDYLDYRQQARGFAELAIFEERDFNLATEDGAIQLRGAAASANLQRLTGVRMLLGRDFLAEDDLPGRQGVVLLGEGLWRGQFGADPGILGRTITLDQKPFSVVGVLPAGQEFPDEARLVVPLALDPAGLPRDRRAYQMVGRLKPGTTLEEAQTDLNAISRRIEQEHRDTNEGWSTRLLSLRESRTGRIKVTLWILTGVVGFVLLIACANVANLLLSRASRRRREVAIRSSLGATRSRVVRQLLTESLLLALIASGIGLLLAYLGLRLLVGSLPFALPPYLSFGLDLRVLAFTLGASVLTALLFGLAPALQTSRVRLTDVLNESSLRGGFSRRQVRLTSLLVIVEIALTILLMIGAGLMIRSFIGLQMRNFGFQTAGVMTARVTLPEARYGTVESRTALFREVLELLSSQPGTAAVAAVSELPLQSVSRTTFTLRDQGQVEQSRNPYLDYQICTPGLFAALGVPLLSGRVFEGEEVWKDEGKVVLINQAMAQQYWPGRDPIGERIGLGGFGNEDWRTVVGVVGNLSRDLVSSAPQPEIFLPYGKEPRRRMSLLLRSSAQSQSGALALRRGLAASDANLPLSELASLGQVVGNRIWYQQVATLVISFFAFAALFLAALGTHSMLSYSVAQRVHEIGVRLALGADNRQVIRGILGWAMALVGIGLGTGLLAAIAVTRVMRSQLIEVSTADPWTFLAVSALVAVVAVLAAYLPARKATRVEPVVALRAP